MGKQRYTDFIVGLFMMAGIAAFVFLAIKVSGLTTFSESGTYRVKAAFTNIGDLKVRAPVTIAGVKIGRVTAIDLNPQDFKAVITMEIDNASDHIPTDSTANIFTAGLLGANYISIAPGFDETFLKNGGEIENTNQALILQNLIGQLLFSLKNPDKNTKESS
ncbi:MAG: outer membrane lipid asymmetry maintenance protein MlaD [Gammaproteobacteria bacterium GWF2_41_13]|nr:MAG: outer membrane lipid asymmetry maintenance protein MlaD [Gammaproteobacteria bacterium GWF2_41_13]